MKYPQSFSTLFSLRLQTLNPVSIKSRLKKAGYPAEKITYPLLGGGGYVVTPDGVMIGGEGDGGGSIRLGKKVNRYAGEGSGFINIGYLLASTERLRIFVMGGVGGGGGGMTIGKKDEQHPERLKKNTAVGMGGGGLRSCVGLGFEFYFGGQVGIVIGARIGLIILPPLLHFGTSQRRIQPFIRLTAGFSGRRA